MLTDNRMMMRPRLLLALAPLLLTAACGTSDDGSEARPIEVLYYVTGATGQQFEMVASPDATCGSLGTGIQSPNVDHQFGTRVFETPYLFVLENAHQPIRAVVRNLSPNDITVYLYLGLTLQIGASEGLIQPGECRTIESDNTTNPPITPKPRGPETQVEVCSPKAGLVTSCLDNTTSQDRSYAYFATIGDLKASNLTNCILTPILDACRTPSTFFLENPFDAIAAVMSVNAGQNAPGQPDAQIRAELYINGEPVVSGSLPVDANAGTDAIVTKNL